MGDHDQGGGENFISGRATAGTPMANDATYWANPANQAALLSGDKMVANAFGIPLNQLTPQLMSQYEQIQTARSSDGGGGLVGSILDKYLPAVLVAAATSGIGSALGGALGSVGAGAVQGGVAAAGTDTLTGAPLTLKSVGVGALGGGLGAAVAPATGAISDATGLPSWLAKGLVKGGIGAGLGGLSGGGTGAAAGGVGGFLNGAVGGATGSDALGKVASGLGGMAISSFLGGGAASPGTGVTSYNPNAPSSMSGGSGTSTDSTLAGIITGAAGVYGSQNAAEKQTQADQNAINTQQSTLGNINNIWSTQQQLGQGAQTALGSALGTNGQPANYSNFENMPGYQFAVQQGTQAIQRQAASLGSAYTPNTTAAVGQYVTGTAAQDYNTYISQLMGAAGLGSTANAGIATPTFQTGENISQLQQNQGQAQASGVSGASNAIGGLFGQNGAGSSLIGAAGKFLSGGTGNGSGVDNGTTGFGTNASPQDPFGGANSVDPQVGVPSYLSNDNGGYDPTSFLNDDFNFDTGGR